MSPKQDKEQEMMTNSHDQVAKAVKQAYSKQKLSEDYLGDKSVHYEGDQSCSSSSYGSDDENK